MSDNLRRGLRTALQTFIGFVAAGAFTTVWNSYVQNAEHPIDPTVTVAMGIVLTMVATIAQNFIEDKTGSGFLLPEDRVAGTIILGKGVGATRANEGKSIPNNVLVGLSNLAVD